MKFTLEKRRVIVRQGTSYRTGNRETVHEVLEGMSNLNTVIYTGSRENAMNIKRAYLNTGDYYDASEPEYM